jgi:transposase
MTFVLTPGQDHEAPVFEHLLNSGAIKRNGRGRPKRVVGDKGYRSRAIRTLLRRRGIRLTIPRKSNERHAGSFSRIVYRQRNQIERLINRLKQYRRIATHYEKHADNYRAMWLIASTILWLQFADTP